MTTRIRAALAGLALLGSGLLAATPASGAPADAVTGAWNDGRSDHDTITDCITGTPGTGLDAQVGWLSPTGRVPVVGEVFWMRTYVGLVSLPCTQRGASFLPEVLLPEGVVFHEDAAHPVEWSLGYAGQPQEWRTDGLDYNYGANGGATVEHVGGEPWYIRQGQVLEIHLPVRATRELKGPASLQPECQNRREGYGPCPVAEAGDHVQVAYTIGGYGSNKRYVTPYVGLFATNGTQPPPAPPAPPTTGNNGNNNGGNNNGGNNNGGNNNGGNDNGGHGDNGTAGRAASRTKASATGRSLRVRVRSTAVPTGTVRVLKGDKTLVRAQLKRGRATVRLPRLPRGRHRLVVHYPGSATVAPSTSKPVVVVIR
ncbi:Ig-like domain-containing protein [Nocardioides sp. SYSU D00065]|uniref:Ig-like domain-containing protein n=1 Tax=Nocardioides sp. SYSU D00065 TaxID=2817378 RepID=UPI001B332FDA|nr:Ig-like domain-containing protein [Nocardioides sp. SYSU D00065]